MLRGYIIAYDIMEPKRLYKVHKALKGYGIGIQYSIFQCYLTKAQFLELKMKIEDIIKDVDRIVIIPLCPSCSSDIETMGMQDILDKPKGYKIY